MTVKELIAELQKLDPELKVVAPFSPSSSPCYDDEVTDLKVDGKQVRLL
jgi:hypothetical protein